MNRIDQAFQKSKNEGRPLFIAYIMGGDPDLKATQTLVPALERAGVDILELGVPFSDPIADGIVNQKASNRSIASGTTLRKLLETVSFIRKNSQVPLVLFSYLNPILQMGFENFARQAAQSGIDGVLTVDLPPEEAAPYAEKLTAAGLKNIFLLAPTTPDERIQKINQLASGFLYYVSRLGVTGPRDSLDPKLEERLKQVKTICTLPLAVGFGISNPQQIRKLAPLCDAIVVGSAIVQRIKEGDPLDKTVEIVTSFVRNLTRELKHAPQQAKA